MLTSIELYDDRNFWTNEVADIWADHVLTPEFDAGQLPAAKASPKQTFGIRQILAKIAGKVQHMMIATTSYGLNMVS